MPFWKINAWILPKNSRPEIRGKVLVDFWFKGNRLGNMLMPKDAFDELTARFADAEVTLKEDP